MAHGPNDPDELWQGYTEQGEPITGRGLTKAECKVGALHGSTHVWLWRTNSKGRLEVLLQRRSMTVGTWPGFYDISSAGHMVFGSTPIETAIIETEEELGYRIKPEDLRLIVVHKQKGYHQESDIQEYEFQWVFTVRLEEDVDFQHDDGEVTETVWVDLERLQDLIDGKVEGMDLLPQGEVYYGELMRSLRMQTNAL